LFVVEHIRLHSFEDAAFELFHLADKLMSQLIIFGLIYVFKITLFFGWLHYAEAVAILELATNISSQLVLILDSVGCPLLFYECIIELLFAVDLVVQKSQAEVARHKHTHMKLSRTES